MKENKILIITIVLFVLFGLIALYFYFIKLNDGMNNNIVNNFVNNQNNSVIKNNTTSDIIENNYLIIGNYLNVSFDNKSKHWRNSSIEKYENKLETYVDNEYYGKYSLVRGKIWNLLDDNDYVDYDGNLIAFSSNLNAEVIKYNTSKIENSLLSEVKTFLLKYGYQYKETSFNYVYYFNQDYYVVLCANLSYLNFDTSDSSNQNYTIGYMRKNNNLYVIFNNKIELDNSNEYPTNLLNGWLVINGKTYLAINEIYYSNNEPNASLYEFDGNKFIKVI